MKKCVAITLIISIVILVLSGCSTRTVKPMEYEDAKTELLALASNVKSSTLPVRLDPNEMYDIDSSFNAQTLPDISEYPFSVAPTTAEFITVYADDNRIIQAAEKFNAERKVINGITVSVGVRLIPSSVATNFILSEKYRPDILIPHSEIYGGMLQYRNIKCEVLEERTIWNTSGVVVSNRSSVSDFSALVEAINNNNIFIGYIDPLQDANGLNFILSALNEFEPTNPMSEYASHSLQHLQNNITYIANGFEQLKSSLLRGVLDGFVTDYKTYSSTSEFNSNYKFIPLGVRQDNPAYFIGEPTGFKWSVAVSFANYCREFGVNVNTGVSASYKSDIILNPFISGELINVYRSIKSGTNDVTAVFVADVSGSMRGSPILKLKTGLRRVISVINPTNNIGLVTFSSSVSIAVPIAQFDDRQQSYFSNAIGNMTDGGNTAMYDAIAVALQMLLESKESNPNTKLLLFVLTDGDSNTGLGYNRMERIIAGLQIPIYVIGYESSNNKLNTNILEKLSALNEASFIDAETDNIVYILESLLNAQM